MQTRIKNQQKLIDEPVRLPNGLVYKPDFITPEEERDILEVIDTLNFSPARFQEFTAKRKIKVFGWSYDFKNEKIRPGPPIPPFLQPVQRKIAKWLDIPLSRVVHALITKYEPGTPIGWHRDTEEFTHVVGVSLAGWCEIRFRPLGETSSIKNSIQLELEPRSAYIMQNDIRWKYQHHIPPTKELRYSITFRTLPEYY